MQSTRVFFLPPYSNEKYVSLLFFPPPPPADPIWPVLLPVLCSMCNFRSISGGYYTFYLYTYNVRPKAKPLTVCSPSLNRPLLWGIHTDAQFTQVSWPVLATNHRLYNDDSHVAIAVICIQRSCVCVCVCRSERNNPTGKLLNTLAFPVCFIIIIFFLGSRTQLSVGYTTPVYVLYILACP